MTEKAAEDRQPRIQPKEVTFRRLSEKKAVEEFLKDGYTEYQKRSMRYGKFLSADSIWARAPAIMFVAYFEERPVAVIGYSRYRGLLLDAGVHVRRKYRGRGLGSILLDKIIEEKGNKTLLVNIANSDIIDSYRRKGFIDMDKDNIPEELLEELNEVDPAYPDQVQKFLQHLPPRWMGILKFSAAMRPSQIDKPEEVEVELDTAALADSCCEQAKLNFIQAWQKIYDNYPHVPETLEVLNYAMHEDYSCDELREIIKRIANTRNNHPIIVGLKNDMQKVLDEWEECEGGN